MNKKIIAVIPAAGRGSRMLSLTDDMPKAMLPLHNRPLISWHLDKLIEENIRDVVIIVGYKKEKLIDYVESVYGDRLNVLYTSQKELNGLAGAVKDGIESCNVLANGEKYNMLVMLGDTIIKDDISSYLNEQDFIGYSLVDDYSRWCLLCDDRNGKVTKFIDKPKNDPITRKAVIGIYYFTNVHQLYDDISYIIDNNIRIKNEYQLSSAMELYMGESRKENFLAIKFDEWYDCGEVESFNNTRKNITRCFNSITITDDNTIIKRSEKENKIKQEINWFLNIPNKLRVVLPQLIDYSQIKSNTFYELEYVNFAPMQELFLYNLPNEEDWEKLFINTFNILERFKLHSSKSRYNYSEHITEVLITKTESRMQEINNSKNNDLKLLFSYSLVKINKQSFKSFSIMWPEIKKYIENNIVSNSATNWQIIHGDLFFGNMLYDINSQTLKLVDPRGNFGIDGIYGDVRYDVAKLMHSVIGRYDFIVNDLFAFIKENNNEYEYILYDSTKHSTIESIFEKHLIGFGYDKEQITVITGLLFISMIPLHYESLNHQKMFYLIGIQLLNKVF